MLDLVTKFASDFAGEHINPVKFKEKFLLDLHYPRSLEKLMVQYFILLLSNGFN